MNIQPDIDLLLAPDAVVKPRLDYTINFTTTRTYYVWLRGYVPKAAGDSVYVGLDDQPMITFSGFTPHPWGWANNDTQSIPVTVEITEPGEHALHILMREDGLHLDRIILTTDSAYEPAVNGPVESERAN